MRQVAVARQGMHTAGLGEARNARADGRMSRARTRGGGGERGTHTAGLGEVRNARADGWTSGARTGGGGGEMGTHGRGWVRQGTHGRTDG